MNSLQDFELYAWVGEDEEGSGIVGLKQVFLPNIGISPMVGIKEHKDKIRADRIADPLQSQANRHGKRIYLVRCVFAEVVETLIPIHEQQ